MKVEPYTIFWTILGPSMPAPMPIADGKMDYFVLGEDTSFPLYISGKQLEALDESGVESLVVTSLNMAAGALLGCMPPRPYIPLTGAKDLRPVLSDYLERYSRLLGYGLLEEFILEITAILRSRNGCDVSARALKNSEYLNVNFDMLLNDLLLDLWEMIASADEENFPKMFGEFHGYLTRAKTSEIHPESIAWYHFARAVTLLFFEAQQPGSVQQEALAEAIAANQNPRLREYLERMRDEKRFDKSLL